MLRRIYKSSSAGTSIYAYDGDNLIEEANSSGTAVARYTQGLSLDEPLAMLRSSATSYYEADGLGSITSLTNSSAVIANTYTYGGFGNLAASSGSVANPFQYTAREFDAETNLYFYRARYYDPSTSRFASGDPIRFAGGSNFYDYVRNDPLNFTDPSGLCPLVTCDTVLPNGKTVGDIVRQERAVLQKALDSAIRADQAGAPSDPISVVTGAFLPIASPNGPIDFKKIFQHKGDPVLLGQAGNFAYYAIGSGYLPTIELDFAASLYAIFAHGSLTSPSAEAVRKSALAANGCQ